MPFYTTNSRRVGSNQPRRCPSIKTKLIIAVCFALLCLDARAETVVVTNAVGLSVTVEANGNYTVQSSAPAWTLGGEMGCPLKHAVVSSGKDLIGRYQRISFEWMAVTSPMSGEIRLYQEKPLVLFSDTRQSAGETPPAPLWSPRRRG